MSTVPACQLLKLGVKRNSEIEKGPLCLLVLLQFLLITFESVSIKVHTFQRLIDKEVTVEN